MNGRGYRVGACRRTFLRAAFISAAAALLPRVGLADPPVYLEEFLKGMGQWRATKDLADAAAADGLLSARSSGTDPMFERKDLALDAGKVSRITVRMSVTGGNSVQLFWGTSNDPTIKPARQLAMPLKADGLFHEYVFKVAAHPAWQGAITRFRLDPTNKAAVGILIDFIRCD